MNKDNENRNAFKDAAESDLLSEKETAANAASAQNSENEDNKSNEPKMNKAAETDNEIPAGESALADETAKIGEAENDEAVQSDKAEDEAADGDALSQSADNSGKNKQKKPKKQKLKSAYRLKYGTYATATAAIFLALVVLFNVLVGVLNDRHPLTIDMTSDNVYSVNSENIEFLKSVKYPVKLHVLFSEELYEDGTYFAQYQSVSDSTGGKYYRQTVELLKQYPKYNKNISVEFVDIYNEQEKLQTLVQDFIAENLSMNYGDILVECYPDGADGSVKRGVIAFADCYKLESQSSTDYYTGTESYTLEGNNIEQAVANGIFKTANLKNVNVALITTNSSEEYVSGFKTTAEQNAFKLDSVSSIGEADFSKYDVMMICAPSADYTENEIKKISDWLDNDGKKGKTLLFMASAASPNLPKIYGLLEEWGISVERGYQYYSKDSVYYSTDRTNIFLETNNTDYTATVDAAQYSYIANNMLPMKALYETETNGTRTVETVVQTADGNTYKKPDNDASWKASGAGDNQPVMLVSKDTQDESSSYVVALSSVGFITNSYATQSTDNGNYRLLINVLNTTSRSDEDQYVMETKVVSNASGTFTGSITAAQTRIIAVVFIGLIPLALIVSAILVYFRRKNY